MIDKLNLIHIEGPYYKIPCNYKTRKFIQYIKTRCIECGNEIFRELRSYKKYKKSFCTLQCQHNNRKKRIDPKGMSIMSRQSNDFYYLLGLIFTDGNIRWPKCNTSANDYACSIELGACDRPLLIKIQKKFGGSVKDYCVTTKTKSNREFSKWTLINKEFIDFLRSIGVTSNKSLTLDINDWFLGLTRIQKNCVMRGIIDGDGCVFVSDKFWKSIINVCSASNLFIETIRKYLPTGVLNIKKQKNPLYVYTFQGKRMLSVIKEIMISKDTNLFLNRKRKKCKQIINLFNKKKWPCRSMYLLEYINSGTRQNLSCQEWKNKGVFVGRIKKHLNHTSKGWKFIENTI